MDILGPTRRPLLALLVVATLVIAIRPAEALAAAGLELTAEATFAVDVDESLVRVSTTYTVRNTKPDRRSGNTITQFYYDRVFFGVPPAAENFTVQSNGRDLSWTEDFEEGTRFLEIKLPSRLLYRQSRTIDVVFELDGSETRSTDPVRVNPAHLTMWAWAWGDPGRSTVRIEVPEGFELEWFGSDGALDGLERDFAAEGVVVWVAENIESPDEWWVSTTGDRPSALEVTDADVGAVQVEIRSWPGDDDWFDVVEATLDDGLPALIRAVGLQWPVDSELVVSQSSVPNRYGFGGWYFTELDEIEIGEDPDAHLVLHEVSHAWFNESLFVERWISEGLADAVPAYVVRNTLDEKAFPTVIVRSAAVAIPLNSWQEPTFDLDDDGVAERWAYNASYWVVHQLVDEIGIRSMGSVMRAADRDEIAYRGVGPIEIVDARDDWHRFLDLLEEVGGSEEATEHFTELVVTSFDVDRLDERTAARARYTEFAEVAGGWGMPFYVRTEMEEWDFEAATAAIEDLTDFLGAADELGSRLAEHGFVFPDNLQGDYETVTEAADVVAMETLIDERVEAVEAYEAAQAILAETPDFATLVGLNEVAAPALMLFEAHQALNASDPARSIALSGQVGDQLAYARAVGQSRIDDLITGAWGLLALLAVALLWSLIKWRRRRRRRKLDDAAAALALPDPDVGADGADPDASGDAEQVLDPRAYDVPAVVPGVDVEASSEPTGSPGDAGI